MTLAERLKEEIAFKANYSRFSILALVPILYIGAEPSELSWYKVT